MHCATFSCLLEGEVDKKIKSIWSPIEPEQEGSEKERWPSSVSHSTGARGRETVEAGVHVTGLGWAPVHMGNSQCLVCFKRLRCWNWSPFFLYCLLSAVKCGNDFCLWLMSRFFWERCIPLLPFFSVPLSLFHLHLPGLHLIRVNDCVNSLGLVRREWKKEGLDKASSRL